MLSGFCFLFMQIGMSAISYLLVLIKRMMEIFDSLKDGQAIRSIKNHQQAIFGKNLELRPMIFLFLIVTDFWQGI